MLLAYTGLRGRRMDKTTTGNKRKEQDHQDDCPEAGQANLHWSLVQE